MWKLFSLLLVFVPAVLAADDTVTNKVFFDIELDGIPAGTLGTGYSTDSSYAEASWMLLSCTPVCRQDRDGPVRQNCANHCGEL